MTNTWKLLTVGIAASLLAALTGAAPSSAADQDLSPEDRGLVAEAVIPPGDRPFEVVSPTQILYDGDEFPTEVAFSLDGPEAAFISNRYGVTRERALEIANWQTDVAPVIEDLTEKARASGVYAHVRVDFGGGPNSDRELANGAIRIDVWVTDLSDAALVESIAVVTESDLKSSASELSRTGADPSSLVRLIEVPKSQADVESEIADLRSALTPEENARTRFEIDWDSGKITAVGYEAVEGVDWVYEYAPYAWESLTDCGRHYGALLDGGRGIAKALSNDNGTCQWYINMEEGTCTAAYPAKMNGLWAMMTAGHCLASSFPAPAFEGYVSSRNDYLAETRRIDQPTTHWAQLTPYWYDNPDRPLDPPLYEAPHDDDVGVYIRKWGSTKMYGRLLKNLGSSGSYRNITHHEFSARTDGLTICESAAASAAEGADTYCGEVIEEESDWAGNTNTTYNQWWTLIDYTEGDFPSGYGGGVGSSGAPAFWGGTVYGVHTNGGGAVLGPNGGRELGTYERTSRVYLSAVGGATSSFQYICYDGTDDGYHCSPY
ncbi:MAG: hypothetical protein GY926_13165 [bacterium]|nr:hypothetical protein [bacterium]